MNKYTGGTKFDAANPMRSPNAFAGAAAKFGGFQKTVTMNCSTCDDLTVVPTDDFRLNWMCPACKSTPVLMRAIGKYVKSTGMIRDELSKQKVTIKEPKKSDSFKWSP